MESVTLCASKMKKVRSQNTQRESQSGVKYSAPKQAKLRTFLLITNVL